MRPSSRPPRRVSTALVLLATLAGPPTALAQFRPPPPRRPSASRSRATRCSVSANAALAKGDKKEAEEKFRKALQLFEQALGEDPRSVASAAGLGTAANALQDFQRTVARVQPVFAQNPEDLTLAYPLGTAYFKLRRFAEAVPVLEKVAAADQPDHLIVHYYLASYYLYAQDGNRAVTRLQRYLVLRPEKLAGNDFQIHELLGKAHLLRRDAPAARAAFEKSQAGRPESAPAQIGLASVLELEGHVPEARALLERLVTKFPEVPGAEGEARAPVPRRRGRAPRARRRPWPW